MILSKRVQLHGVQLDEIDYRIVIRSVEPGTPKKNTSAVNRMMGVGQRITGDHWESLETVVTWAVDIPKEQMSDRRTVFAAVAAWANAGGWLAISEMPNRYMYVDRVVIDSPGDYWDWTKDYKITFKAYNVPFWQGDLNTVQLYGATNTWTVTTEGHEKSIVDATYSNLSGAVVNNILFKVDQVDSWGNVYRISTIKLTDVGLGGSDVLTVSHGTDGILRITATGKDGGYLMKCLDISSTDDLYLPVGSYRLGFEADRYGETRFTWRGRWL